MKISAWLAAASPLALALLLFVACGAGGEPGDAAGAGAVDPALDGVTSVTDVAPPPPASREVRRSFLGGYFVTYSGAMPREVDQAIAGVRPDRPVVVWAGK